MDMRHDDEQLLKFHVVMETNYDAEETFSTIISSWVSVRHDDNTCTAFWPPEKEVLKSIKLLRSPKKNWKEFDCEIVATYDTYEKARKKEALLVANISSSETEDFLIRKRIPKKKIQKDYTDNSSSSITPPPTFSPTSSVTVAAAQNVEKGTSDYTTDTNPNAQVFDLCDIPIIEAHSIETGDIINGNNIQIVLGIDQIIQKLDLMHKRIIKLDVTVQDLTTSINKIEKRDQNSTRPAPLISNFIFDFPLKNVDSILELEESIITDDSKKDELFHYFKNVGGKNERNAVQKCMGNLLTNKVSDEVSWCGRKGNIKIGHLQIFKIMLAGIRVQFPNLYEKVFEQIIMDFLKLAKQRLERETKEKM